MKGDLTLSNGDICANTTKIWEKVNMQQVSFDIWCSPHEEMNIYEISNDIMNCEGQGFRACLCIMCQKLAYQHTIHL